jgi:hypothetical protein
MNEQRKSAEHVVVIIKMDAEKEVVQQALQAIPHVIGVDNVDLDWDPYYGHFFYLAVETSCGAGIVEAACKLPFVSGAYVKPADELP